METQLSQDGVNQSGPAVQDGRRHGNSGLRVVAAIANVISQRLDLDETLRQVLCTVLDALEMPTCGGIFLVDHQAAQLLLRAWHELDDEWVARNRSLGLDECLCGEAVKSGQVMLTSEVDEAQHAQHRLMNAHDHIIIPLKTGGIVQGVMFLCLDAPYQLSDDDVQLLTVVGNQIAGAIRNGLLFEEMRRSAAEFQALSELARMVGQTLELDEALNCALDEVLNLLGRTRGGMFVLDTSAFNMRLVAHRHLEPDWVARSQVVSAGEGRFGGMNIDAHAIITTPEKAPPALVGAGNGELLAAVPLRSKGKVLGVMFIIASHARDLPDVALQLLSAIGNQIGVAIENTRLLRMVKRQQSSLMRRHRQMIALNVVSSTVNQSLDLDRTMSAALSRALEIMDLEMGWIRLIDRDLDLLVLGPSQGVPPDLLARLEPLEVGEGISGMVAKTGDPIVMANVTDDPRALVAGSGLDAFLSVPLRSQDRIIGTMNLASFEDHPFALEDIMLAMAIGDQVGVACENARLFQALERSKQEWESTFSAMQDGIAIVDRNLRLVRVNEALANMFDLSPEEMLGRRCCNVFYGREGPMSHCRCQQIIHTQRVASIETDLLACPGIYDIRLYPLVDTSGEVAGVIHSFRDVTETRSLRNLMAQNEKLIALGRLAASVAHEVNNPLFSIGNCLTLLDDSIPLDDPNKAFVRLAQSELTRMGETVERMLDFARPTHEPREPVDINHLIDNALLLTDKHMDYSKVVAVTNLDPALPTILASGNQLTQVFINLILNAIEAMAKGGELRVSTRYLERVDQVQIKFTDTGHGIAPEHLKRIFEPFFSTKGEVKGVGLGLAISYGIVQGHGGTIDVSSQVGKGTTFTIKLPVPSQAELETWEQAEEAS